ncbi:MAG: bifunctional phosphoribosylaminoimidazolecarboxamide formyltransferase/IMP cyclohydrolase [Candidatus ainarchaeum sp.]|nr:bifunctional phosphoribosylaminoimidazolecarboxamide formyltransferase/IMP cyclohydrolase [Candidatus ainarchaeum sp.]
MEKIALISVSDKTGLLETARVVQDAGYKIIATGGTAKAIKEAGIEATEVSDFTGFPEILGGRVKTLHPKIHAGILARRKNKQDLEILEQKKIALIDIVIINLYPFKETISKQGISLEEAVENIDIGGPSMIRAAAKNFESVTVIVSPLQYPELISQLKSEKATTPEFRKKCAAKAFEHTAFYDALIQDYFHSQFLQEETFSEKLVLAFEKKFECRYGENPHQRGAFYGRPISPAGIASAKQLNGKELSFNNIYDADAALELLSEFEEPAAVIVKHTNPCGAASAEKIENAFEKALDCDKLSAFGGIIALNRQCNIETAVQITSFFNEIVIAPAFENKALEKLREKKNLRILESKQIRPDKFDFKKINSGLLVQEKDSLSLNEKDLQFVSEKKPSENQLRDLLFAWKIAKHVKSNAIVLAKEKATVGIGAGQMSRVDSVEFAIKKSGAIHKKSVLASDGFFPFRDSIDIAAKAGIEAIMEPGGSIQDKEVIQAANQHKIALVFSGKRHFKH